MNLSTPVPARGFALSAVSLFAVFGSLACGVVYPEVQTPLRTPPPGFPLAPPPPDDLLYLRFEGADVPPRTVDGRAWDEGGGAPDPFAKLLVNGKEIIVTPVDSDTLRPKWADQVRANYRIARGSAVHVEVWDKNAIKSRPICKEDIDDLHAQVNTEHPLEIDCESGARVRLVVEPAHGRLGMGLYYELHTEAAYVTRVLAESPARRAGLVAGDEIQRVQGQDVRTMEEGKLQSLVNANASMGVEMTVKRGEAPPRTIKLKDGAIYPVIGEPVGVE
ncbi:MAG TPA: PDZ domain-containing protein [Polyangiaceae bacterium]